MINYYYYYYLTIFIKFATKVKFIPLLTHDFAAQTILNNIKHSLNYSFTTAVALPIISQLNLVVNYY